MRSMFGSKKRMNLWTKSYHIPFNNLFTFFYKALQISQSSAAAELYRVQRIDHSGAA